MIYIAICYDSCYNKATAADRPVIRASTSFSGNIRGEFASTWFRGQGPCERGPEKDASAALREKDFVRYSENFAQRFQLVRINMALAHLHLGKRTARHVASAHLKLCRRLFLGKLSLHAQPPDVFSQRLLILRVHISTPPHLFWCNLC